MSSGMSVVEALLNMASNTRVRLWLRLHYPGWFTVDEISSGLPLFSKTRVQQLVQQEFEKDLVERRRRDTGKPGPNPFEYRVSPRLFRDLTEETIQKILKLDDGNPPS